MNEKKICKQNAPNKIMVYWYNKILGIFFFQRLMMLKTKQKIRQKKTKNKKQDILSVFCKFSTMSAYY